MAASQGLLPAIYHKINAGNEALSCNIVNRKSTMWKKPRTLSEAEAKELGRRMAVVSESMRKLTDKVEELVPNALVRHLMCVSQPISSLGFNAKQTKMLVKVEKRIRSCAAEQT